jgi:hypothetical protein
VRKYTPGDRVAVRLPDGTIEWANVLHRTRKLVITDLGTFFYDTLRLEWRITRRDPYFLDAGAVMLKRQEVHVLELEMEEYLQPGVEHPADTDLKAG